ncbi:GAF and ANTAR domain-containing protein [Actinomycetospora straminea]|uniref:GAF and ANTAR domain-containing protein n=1 Tax=Actinomycetospora straminea TaxID=663607 RepID=A0ABP9ERU0_9PSEU|nr:GAF and ANTAR domain-containing protein [Actinomycetospora straminea]MDD7935471.1 GAF and ANTAR domain-containing protein [Actinomycetospora straminea]
MTTPPQGREQLLVETFVRLADTLVADYDVIDLFHQLCADCIDLLAVDAAGLLITDQRDSLQVVSASTEATHLLELFQLQADQGPCLDCFHTSAQVHAPELRAETRWPRFTAHAIEYGFAAVHALPMRLRGLTIGAVNLFHRRAVAMTPDQLGVSQALADVATIAILTDRGTRERDQLTEQLQAALTSRVVIEQAKGVLGERGTIGLDDAFSRMRDRARATNQRLTDLARGVVDGTLDTDTLLRSSRSDRRPQD